MANPVDRAVDRLLRGEPVDKVVAETLGEMKSFANKGQKLGKLTPMDKKMKRTRKRKPKKEMANMRDDYEDGGEMMSGEYGDEYMPEDEEEAPELYLIVDGSPVYDTDGNLVAVGPNSRFEFAISVEDEEMGDEEEMPPEEGGMEDMEPEFDDYEAQ